MDKYSTVRVNYRAFTDQIADLIQGAKAESAIVAKNRGDWGSPDERIAALRGRAEGLFEAWQIVCRNEYALEDFNRLADLL